MNATTLTLFLPMALFGSPLAVGQFASPALEFLDSPGEAEGSSVELPLESDVVVFQEHDGTLWCRGRHFKASADIGGFTYVPFFGSEAPRNFPVRFGLASVTAAGEPMPIPEATRVRLQGNRVILGRGPIDEVYDVSMGSVEQSFVLNAAGLRGNLVLHVDVDTDLVARESSSGVRFENAWGAVDYEHAVVFDAAGSRLELPIHLIEGQVRLEVPRAFLAGASDPITVDPVISSTSLYLNLAKDAITPDVAFLGATSSMGSTSTGYVFDVPFSATDHDVRFVQVNANTTAIWVDFTTANWVLPKVASDSGSRQYLVTALGANASGLNDVYAVAIRSSNLDLSPRVIVGDTFVGQWNNHACDVAGKSSGPSLFKIVWERELLVPGRRVIRSAAVTPVQPHSTATPPSVSTLESVTGPSATEDFTLPAISRSSGGPGNGEWRCVFLREDFATGVQKIYGARWTDTNQLSSPPVSLFTPSIGFRIQGLDVSEGLTSRPGPLFGEALYCVTASMTNPSGGDDVWVYGAERDEIFGASLLSSREHRPLNPEQAYPSVGATASQFVVSYREYDPASNHYQYLFSGVHMTNSGKVGVSERRTLLLDAGDREPLFPASIATSFSAGLPGETFRVIAPVRTGTGTFEMRGIVASVGEPATIGYQYCNGTLNSTGDYGFISISGGAGPVASKTLHASSLPLSQFGFFLTSQGGFDTVPAAGSAGRVCISGAPIGRYSQSAEIFTTGSTGRATLAIDPMALRAPSGNVVGAAGQTWNFQAWHRDSPGGSNFTNAVSLLL
ncbi:hypothetical protein Poly30_18020 [Planctomycetes bacterium Poly30]|uniref:IgGFc-binding protein N-terminal domain-containing protein n=1 Tax=Saltatorellus ferox TaxID=2528018 RepID=A0A518EQD1_9BACT|nr:hypothetical protein Poly30_18020 [Planctomycetes bacterium Poly30]